MAVRSSERTLFRAAYVYVLGSTEKSVDAKKLTAVCIAAGKDVIPSQILKLIDQQKESLSYTEAFDVFQKMAAPQMEKECESINPMRTARIPVDLLYARLDKRSDLSMKPREEIKQFLGSFSDDRGDIDWRYLVEEVEGARLRLMETILKEYASGGTGNTQGASALLRESTETSTGSETVICAREGDDSQRNKTKFAREVKRRGFRLMHPDEKRTLDFRFHVNNKQRISVAVELIVSNDQPSTRVYTNGLYLVLHDVNNDEVIDVTQTVDGLEYVSREITLDKGMYSTTIHSCCRVDLPSSSSAHETLVDDTGKLSKNFRMCLMKIFDLFDFDQNGTLSRAEFDAYNMVASDEHVSDQEWNVLQQRFHTRNGELTLNSIIALHQIESENSEDVDEMWISLKCIGYNEQLALLWNSPCVITLRSEDEIELDEAVFGEFGESRENTLARFFWERASECAFPEQLNLRLWKCDYFAVCLAGPMKVDSNAVLNYSDSQNVAFDEKLDLSNVKWHFENITILFVANSTAPDWSIALKLDTDDP